ncbi:splicing factor CC1-like protein [Clavulina sp. PMI_390]|nr:splicing factor CC1-like protein [Clavulina sp. PMI_390]
MFFFLSLFLSSRRPSPSYDDRHHGPPPNDDSEARSVFVSQLAARMTPRDLGYFFEEHLGEGSVIDPRIVTDRLSRRSKGIAYIELSSIDLVQKALDLSGTVVMGLPIKVQLTESERNKQPSGSGGSSGSMQLYVGSLHFNLTEADIKQVFEPFGELEFVDLHKDAATGRSKGYAFVQFKRAEDAKMALEQMEGFELAGRQLRVNTVHEKGSNRSGAPMSGMGGPIDSLDENGGSLNNNSSRHILMQKLARTDAASKAPVPARPVIPEAKTRNIALKNMFNPAEETDKDWDIDLADDVKGECESTYGTVNAIKVIKDSQGEIYVQFNNVESATKALHGLNGRWFGGRNISASYVSDAIMQAHL